MYQEAQAPQRGETRAERLPGHVEPLRFEPGGHQIGGPALTVGARKAGERELVHRVEQR